MKVLLINGSPHEKGCTYTALSEIAGVLNENGIDTEIFQIGSVPYGAVWAAVAVPEKTDAFFRIR